MGESTVQRVCSPRGLLEPSFSSTLAGCLPYLMTCQELQSPSSACTCVHMPWKGRERCCRHPSPTPCSPGPNPAEPGSQVGVPDLEKPQVLKKQ